MAGKLDGKVAVVTGAGAGIGEAIARLYAEEGCRVVVADRQRNAAERVAQDIGGLAAVTDVADEAQVAALFKSCDEAHGRLDILVNNAGVPGPTVSVENEDMAVWDETMAVNVRAPFLLTRRLWDHMVERGGGCILNVASVSGKRAGAGNATYSASKYAIIGFTESLSKAGREVNIRACAVCPGPVATVMRAGNNPTEDPTGILTPNDIAELALFVATRPARVVLQEAVMELNPSWSG